MTIGPSMANILEYYGRRRANGLAVNPDPLAGTRVSAAVNPDRLIRDGQLQYVVWDAFSAERSSFFAPSFWLRRSVPRSGPPHRDGGCDDAFGAPDPQADNHDLQRPPERRVRSILAALLTITAPWLRQLTQQVGSAITTTRSSTS